MNVTIAGDGIGDGVNQSGSAAKAHVGDKKSEGESHGEVDQSDNKLSSRVGEVSDSEGDSSDEKTKYAIPRRLRFDSSDPELDTEAGPHTDDVSFLESPEILWQESQVEEILWRMGNVRDYYYFGKGHAMEDQDIFACLAASDILLNESLLGPELHNQTENHPTQVLPFGCARNGGCKCISGASRVYKPLPSEDHFRLLEILPGLSESPMQCRLHISRLSKEHNTYEALSYTWLQNEKLFGSEEPVRETTIRCNDSEIAIGANLAAALQRLRETDSSRIVWADALCINQDDVAERSHQVSKMGSVFEQAFQVVAWLGCHIHEKDKPIAPAHARPPYRAFEGVCAVVNAWRQHHDRQDDVPLATHSPSVTRPGENKSSTSQANFLGANSSLWHDIFHLFRQRWFSRVWVIQEVALARAAVVLWDKCEISWNWIGLAAAIIRTNYNRLSDVAREKRMSSIIPKPPSRRVPTGVANAYFMYRLCQSQTYSMPLKFTFYELLKLTRQFECKDDRDRIYGLLGLPTTDDVGQKITADYSQPLSEVYIDVARKLIEYSSSPAVLSSVQRDHNNLWHRYWNPRRERFDWDLPSWVPQWHFLLGPSLSQSQPLGALLAASGTTPLQCKDTGDPRTLTVCGRIIGKVTMCKYTSSRDFLRGANKADKAKRVRQWKRTQFPRLKATLNKYRRQKGYLEEVAMTLTAGRNWYGVPVQDVSAHLADYTRCLLKDGLVWSLADAAFGERRHSEPGQEESSEPATGDYVTYKSLKDLSNGGNADRFLDAAATVCQNRACFTMEGGAIGVGPEAMQENDLVCVLYGGDSPFIIRQVEAKGYLLMGECYVRALMRGRALAAEQNVEEAWIKLI